MTKPRKTAEKMTSVTAPVPASKPRVRKPVAKGASASIAAITAPSPTPVMDSVRTAFAKGKVIVEAEAKAAAREVEAFRQGRATAIAYLTSAAALGVLAALAAHFFA